MVQRSRPRSFICVILETPTKLADDAAGIFAAYGSIGCEIRKLPGPRLPKSATRARLHAYFDKLSDHSLRRITDTLKQSGMISAGADVTLNSIEDPGWATMWQKRFEPFPVGDRFLIVPPWNRSKALARTPIVIRPGQAFGTGHHASTFGTLNVIEDLCGARRFERALDVGTGSGILAIAMHKLGARKIVAIDLDVIALENAVENADLNSLGDAVRFSVAPLSSIRGHFDLITANILSSVLLVMAPQLKARLRPAGYLVLAGILAREADTIVAAYAPELNHLRTRADGVWRALVFQR
jgi:ribosomal protein L11 methyltransferase